MRETKGGSIRCSHQCPQLLTLLQDRLCAWLSLGGDFGACFPQPTLPLPPLPRNMLRGHSGAFQQLYATPSESHHKQVQTLLLDFGKCCLRDRFAYKYPLFSHRLFAREAGTKKGSLASAYPCCCCSFLPELVLLPVPASQALSVLRGARTPKWAPSWVSGLQPRSSAAGLGLLLGCSGHPARGAGGLVAGAGSFPLHPWAQSPSGQCFSTEMCRRWRSLEHVCECMVNSWAGWSAAWLGESPPMERVVCLPVFFFYRRLNLVVKPGRVGDGCVERAGSEEILDAATPCRELSCSGIADHPFASLHKRCEADQGPAGKARLSIPTATQETVLPNWDYFWITVSLESLRALTGNPCR